MSRPGALLVMLVTAAFGAGGFIYGLRSMAQSGGLRDQVEFLDQRVGMLEEENLRLQGLVDRMERAGVVDDPEAVIRRDLELVAGDMRGLEWKNRVRYKVVTADGIGDLIREKLRGPPVAEETARRRMVAWEAMGWTVEGLEWGRLVGLLYPGTASAFYDEEKGVLHVARGAPLEEAYERVLLVHELIYALLDQNFDLKSFYAPVIDELWRDTDQGLARRALASGNASLTTLQYNLQFGSPMVAADANWGEFGALAALLGPGAGGGDGEAEVPAAARAMASFPHASGRLFCGSLFDNMSYLEIDAAYGRPPQCTAEILHPELYAAGDFRPRRFDWKEEKVRVAEREILWSDVAGELGTRLLLERFLSEEGAAKAAAGWRGDRFIVYGAADPGAPGADVLWRTAWASREEAHEFREALAEVFRRRYSLNEPVAGRYDGERFLLLEMTDDTEGVILVDATTQQLREEIRGRLR